MSTVPRSLEEPCSGHPLCCVAEFVSTQPLCQAESLDLSWNQRQDAGPQAASFIYVPPKPLLVRGVVRRFGGLVCQDGGCISPRLYHSGNDPSSSRRHDVADDEILVVSSSTVYDPSNELTGTS
jgi:hypothetical protein